MSLFLAMLSKLFPLYATMGAGFGLSRVFGNMSQTLAQIQIYFVAPVIIMASMMKLNFSADLVVMPILLALISVAISAATNYLSRKAGSDYAPLLAQGSGAMNSGYLGIPVAAILFPDHFLPVYIFTMLGGLIYEVTLGYYWIARGKYTMRDAFISLLKMPLFYAVVVGLLLNGFGVVVPEMWQSVARDFLGAYVVLGALIVGVGLAQNKRLALNFKLLGTMLGIKFLIWPLVTVVCLGLLRFTPLAVPSEYEPIMLLLSVLPLAANTAVMAALLDVHPEEAATAVALSTVLSIFIVPAYALLFGFANV